jgi:cystathionine beta-synthase
MAKIQSSILESIGNKPLVRLKTIGRGTGCEILAKCEHLNAGGSVKDRIGLRMIQEAEKSGRIKRGDTLIEPTSGNTGIGMALAAAVYGYRMIITMPEKMSREKQVVLEALGAEIIRTPTEAAWDAPESHIGVARHLERILPNAHILDQYANPDNPTAHFEGTGTEILEQTDGQLDFLVISAGTGGTITGVAKRIKRDLPDVKVIGVDPEGSILAGPGPIGSYKVEGIGYDFVPDVLDRSIVDEWIKSNDRDSFQMARRLIRQEGLLVGGSSGSAAWAAVEVARKYGPDKRIVTLFPDSVRNYMTKFLDDAWMRENGFSDSMWEASSLGDLLRSLPPRDLIVAGSGDTVGATITRMKDEGISQVPVVDEGGLAGIVTEADLLHRLVAGSATPQSAVAEVMMRNPRTVNVGDDAGVLTDLFATGHVALVTDDAGALVGLISKMDLVDHLTRAPGSPR